MKLINESNNQVILKYEESILDTIETSKLKGNPYNDTESGIVRIYATHYGLEKEITVKVQLRKVVGKYTYLNSFNVSTKQLKEIAKIFEKEVE